MMKRNFFLWMIIPLMGVASCAKDEPADPIIPNEEEVITTLIYTLVPQNGGDSVVLMFQDLDGEGGNLPFINSGSFDTNTTYVGTLQLLNELENPAGDITEEVKEEGVDHQFFFQPTASGVSVDYDDFDANSLPIGIETTLHTGGADSGNLTIILRHLPNKTASGVSGGDITNAGGETDIEVTFQINVQ